MIEQRTTWPGPSAFVACGLHGFKHRTAGPGLSVSTDRGLQGAERRAAGPEQPVRRRLLLRLPLLAVGSGMSAAALSACGGTEDEDPGPEPVTEIGTPVAAPSGEVTAVLDTAGNAVGVVLRDASGTDIWADDFPYAPTMETGLLWETAADVLWVLSADLGTARIAQTDGVWSKQMPVPESEIPEQIAHWIR